MLARELPTLENGGLVLYPDGTMLTTYRLRENLKWHDGQPVTAADFAFAYQVYIDPELPIAVRNPENLMAGLDVVDNQAFRVRWKKPYFRATSLTEQMLVPLAKHLLQDRYFERIGSRADA